MKKYVFIICALLVVVAGCSGGPADTSTTVNDDTAVTDNRFGWGDIGSGGDVDDDEDTADPTVTTPRPTGASSVDIDGTIKRSFIVGETLNAELSATGGSGSYIWSIESVRSSTYSFPEWVSLGEQTDNTVKITGTAVAGKFKFKVKVCDESDDGNCDTSRTFTIIVGTLELALMPSVSLSTDPCFRRLGIDVIEYTKMPSMLPGCGVDPTLPGCSTLSDTLPNIGLLGEEEITIKFKAKGKGPFTWSVKSAAEDQYPDAFCPVDMPRCNVGVAMDSNFSMRVSSSEGADTYDILTVGGRFMNGIPEALGVSMGDGGPTIVEEILRETLTVGVKDQCLVYGTDENRSQEKKYTFHLKSPPEVLRTGGLPSLMLEIDFKPESSYGDGLSIELYDGIVSEGHPEGNLIAKTDPLEGWGGFDTYVARIDIVNALYMTRSVEDIKKVKIVNDSGPTQIRRVMIYSRYRYVEFMVMRDLPLLFGSSSARTLDAFWKRNTAPLEVCPPDALDTDHDGDSEEPIERYSDYIEDSSRVCVGE